jgi:putative membrane protein insertion efficiency factor
MGNKYKNFIFNLPKRVVVAIISFYQATLSPDHGWLRGRFPHGYCRFYPSCSEYTKQSVERFGVVKGLWLGMIRLSKCHPWSEPKVDPVPNL